MYKLGEKRFSDFFHHEPETGMGYWVATVFLRDGREFRQVVIDSGYVNRVRGYKDIPFKESDIERFVVTHDKWDWDSDDP